MVHDDEHEEVLIVPSTLHQALFQPPQQTNARHLGTGTGSEDHFIGVYCFSPEWSGVAATIPLTHVVTGGKEGGLQKLIVEQLW